MTKMTFEEVIQKSRDSVKKYEEEWDKYRTQKAAVFNEEIEELENLENQVKKLKKNLAVCQDELNRIKNAKGD